MESGGQMSETDCPYENQKTTCRLDTSRVVARVSECYSILLSDEELIKEALHRYGPLSVSKCPNIVIYYYSETFSLPLIQSI